MAYAPYPIVTVKLDALLLDLENYRIPTRPSDEATALKYLFVEEEVLEAAESILRMGYFDNEVPIALETITSAGATGYVVVEGNRRVAALKVLRKPALVPGHEKEVRALLKRYATEVDNLPTEIRVIVAPSKQVSDPHMARLHTGLSKKAWSLDQQASYYAAQLTDDTSVTDVKSLYPDVDVVRFLKMANMRRYVGAAKYSDASLNDFAKGARLSMSSLEYAYKSPDIAEAIGVSFDKSGSILPTTKSPESIARDLSGQELIALEHLMSEFRAGHLNTRSNEFKKRPPHDLVHDAFVALLRGAAPTAQGDPLRDRSSSPDSPGARANHPDNPERPNPGDGKHQNEIDGGTRDQNEPATVSQSVSRGPNGPDTKRTLSLGGVDFEKLPTNHQRRFQEFRKLGARDHPHTLALAMRSLLETTIKYHFESSPTKATGELRTVFPLVETEYGAEKALMASVQRLKSGSVDKPGSITWFNAVAHNGDHRVKEEAIREAWDVVQPILRRLVNDPRS